MGFVITGLGGVTPIGHTWRQTSDGLYKGKLGGGEITHFDASSYPVRIAAEVKDWDPQKQLPIDNNYLRKGDVQFWMALATTYAVSAVTEAVAQSGLDTKMYGSQGGLWLGNGGGGIGGYYHLTELITQNKWDKIRGDFMVKALQNMIGAWATRVLGIHGPTQNVQTACASSIDAAATALAFLSSPIFDLKFAVVVGAEAAVDEDNIAAFAGTEALSTRNDDPAHASRPFTATRDGFVLAEGAGAFVVEEESFAKQRGANPLARLRTVSVGSAGGVGAEDSVRGPKWLTEPNVPYCIQLAARGLDMAGWERNSVDVWVAHGTSTGKNDLSETRVIKGVFGEHAYQMAVTANKSMLGHGLGAAGIWNMNTAVTILQEQRVPPTMNYVDPDPECDLDYVPNQARDMEVNRVITAALGFGDQNGYAFLERFDGWEV